MAKKTSETAAEIRRLQAEIKTIKAEIAASEREARRKRNEPKECAMKFRDAEVIITDPCYLIRNRKHWIAFVDRIPFSDGPTIRSSGKLSMLVANTIWGDWMCELRGTLCGSKYRFGEFTADAGLVCACAPDARRLDAVTKRLPCHCYTLLHGFTGTIRIVHRRGVCHVEGSGRTKDGLVEFRSRQVG